MTTKPACVPPTAEETEEDESDGTPAPSPEEQRDNDEAAARDDDVKGVRRDNY